MHKQGSAAMQSNRNYQAKTPSKRRRIILILLILLLLAVAGYLVWRYTRFLKTDPPSITGVKSAKTTDNTRTETVIETEIIPYAIKTIDDPNKFVGSSTVERPGAYGVKTVTYEISYVGKVAGPKKLMGETITKEPVEQIVSVGTKQSGDPE